MSGAGQTSGGPQGSAAPAGQPQATPNAFGQPQADNSGGAPKEQAKAEAPAKRYLEADADDALVKVKIDGQEQEISVKELKRLSSLERASQKRMQDAAKIQREYQQMQERLANDPWELLAQAGKDPDALAEERLARKYELSQMNPVERENLELKQRLEAQQKADFESKRGVLDEIKKLGGQLPKDAEKFPKEQLQAYRDHLHSVEVQAKDSLQKEMIGAWEETGLPKHATWGNWMAMEMMSHEKRTGQPLSARDAAVKVKADFQKFSSTMFAQMDAKAIHDFVGKEVVQKLMDYKIQGVTDQAAQGFAKPSPTPVVSDPKKPYMTESEYRQWLKS